MVEQNCGSKEIVKNQYLSSGVGNQLSFLLFKLCNQKVVYLIIYLMPVCKTQGEDDYNDSSCS